jgi:DNA polymerase-3 subunit alpha
MFGGQEAAGSSRPVNHALPQVPELADAELLKFEKELLGFYITSHPLTEHQSALENFSTASTKEAMLASENSEVIIGGMISRVKKSVTKNGRSAGQSMAMITLEDLEGQIDGVLFAETYADILKRFPGSVANERIVFLRGKIDKRRETPSIVVNDLIPIEEAAGKLTTMIGLKLDSSRHGVEIATALEAVLAKHPGGTEVFLQVTNDIGRKITLRLGKDRSLRPTRALVEDVERLLGRECIQLWGQGTRRRKKLVQQQPLFQEAEEAELAGTASVEPAAEDVAEPEEALLTA